MKRYDRVNNPYKKEVGGYNRQILDEWKCFFEPMIQENQEILLKES